MRHTVGLVLQRRSPEYPGLRESAWGAGWRRGAPTDRPPTSAASGCRQYPKSGRPRAAGISRHGTPGRMLASMPSADCGAPRACVHPSCRAAALRMVHLAPDGGASSPRHSFSCSQRLRSATMEAVLLDSRMPYLELAQARRIRYARLRNSRSGVLAPCAAPRNRLGDGNRVEQTPAHSRGAGVDFEQE